MLAAYKYERENTNVSDGDMSNESQQTTLNGWDDENVNRKFLILQRTRATKVDVVKHIPIFTQSKDNVVVAIQSKFGEIRCVFKMKHETANELKTVQKQYCMLSRIELCYLAAGRNQL